MEQKEIKSRAKLVLNPPPPPSFWESRLVPFLDKYCVFLCFCFVAAACSRIVATYTKLSLTADEPLHFMCGLEYVAKHAYSLAINNPPLSRAAQALGPYLAGARPLGVLHIEDAAFAVIARSGNVDRMVFLMRLGNLPFFLLACVVVGWWSWHAFGKPVAVLATGLFTLLPTTLADGGLATTDMALEANLGAAFLVAILWAEKPTWLRSVLLGLSTGLACLSKFTALAYLPSTVCFALMSYLAVRWPGLRGSWELARRRALPFALAAGTTATIIWAGYWFSFGKVPSPVFLIGLLGKSCTLPAPEFVDGIRQALQQNRSGWPAFLLGEFRMTGWWYYYLVALAVKTPIAFLILVALGTFVCVRERNRAVYLLPVAFSLGILIQAMRIQIDIGIRHINPIYIGLAIISALGLKQICQWCRTGIASGLTAGVLLVWMGISVAVHHPDYLAYFNEFAGKEPGNILVDSNYDWGQDLKFLAERLHKLGVKEFSLASPYQVRHHDYLEAWYGLPNIKSVNDSIPSPGWSVVSPTYDKSWRLMLYGPHTAEPWYDRLVPNERVGPLRLYYVAPATKASLRGDVSGEHTDEGVGDQLSKADR